MTRLDALFVLKNYKCAIVSLRGLNGLYSAEIAHITQESASYRCYKISGWISL